MKRALFTLFDVRGLFGEALEAAERLGPWGPVLFIAAYVLATVLFVPGSALTLGAGALFGLGWGAVYVSLGARWENERSSSNDYDSRPRHS
jgi:uncharacterized membrane protein YdjX (TVP38/TMEM64 family)